MKRISKFWVFVLIAAYFVTGLLAAPGFVRAEEIANDNSGETTEQQDGSEGNSGTEELTTEDDHDHDEEENDEDHDNETEEEHSHDGEHEHDHNEEEDDHSDDHDHEEDHEEGDEHDDEELESGSSEEDHDHEGEDEHDHEESESGDDEHNHEHEEDDDHEDETHDQEHDDEGHEEHEHSVLLEKVAIEDTVGNCSLETVRYLADLEPGTYTLSFNSSVTDLLTLVVEQLAGHDHGDHEEEGHEEHDHDHDEDESDDHDHEEEESDNHEDEDHDHEDEHDHDDEALAELDEHACLHQAFGEPEMLEAATDHEEAADVDVSAPHTRYDLTFPESENGYTGFVSYEVTEDAEYSFYLSADVEFEVLTESYEEEQDHDHEGEGGTHGEEDEEENDHEENEHEHEDDNEEDHGHSVLLEKVAIEDVAGNCSIESVRYLADLEPGTYTLSFSSGVSDLLTLVIEQFAGHDHGDHEEEGHEGHNHEDEHEGEEDEDHEEHEEDHDHDEGEDDDNHEEEEGEHEHEGEESEYDEEALAELDEHGCLHQAFGEPEVLDAATDHEEAADVDVSTPHTRYDISLPESESGHTGYVTFQVEEDAVYSFYLSADVEFGILAEEDEEHENHDYQSVLLEKVGIIDPTNVCSVETVRYLADLEPGNYTLSFNSSVTSLLTLVIEQFIEHDHEHEHEEEEHEHEEEHEDEDHEDLEDDHDHEDDENKESDEHEHEEEDGDHEDENHEEDSHEHEEGNEHEGEEHDHDEEALAELDEHACLHQAFGEPVLLDAANNHETALDVDVSAPHTRYDLTLQGDEEEGYLGFASFQVEEDAEYSFYLSADVEFGIFTEEAEEDHDHENEHENEENDDESGVDTANSQNQNTNNNGNSGGSNNQTNNNGVGGQPLSHNPELDEHACLHVNHGPERAVISTLTTAAAPDVSRAHTRFDITLPGNGSNFVKYVVNEDIDYVFYLTNNVPFSILNSSGQTVNIAAYGDPVQNCPAAATKHLTRLANGTYYLQFIPSGQSNVSLVVEKSELESESENENQDTNNNNQESNNNSNGGGGAAPITNNISDNTTTSTTSTFSSTTTTSEVEDSVSSDETTDEVTVDSDTQITEEQSEVEEQSGTTGDSISDQSEDFTESSVEERTLTQRIEGEGSEQVAAEFLIEDSEDANESHPNFEGEKITAANNSASENNNALPLMLASIGSIGLFFAIRLILL